MIEGKQSMEDWMKVHDALNDTKWDFRTIEGIAKQTDLDPERVGCLLGEYQSEIRQVIARNHEIIYTLRSRPVKVREVIADLQTFASSSF